MLRFSKAIFLNGNGIRSAVRTLATTGRCNTKVAVIGAGGGIGQPLSLLLKHSPYIKSLALYDLKNVDGVAMDLSHIDTSSKVYGYTGETQLNSCLDGAEIVVISAGIPRKPGMQRSDLFDVNAKIVTHVVDQICKSTFNPFIAIVTNPVNSMVPVAAEVLRLNGLLDTRKLFGVTTLDLVRASTFYAQMMGCDPRETHVPVVAGHSGESIVPLFSLATPKVKNTEKIASLVNLVRDAGTQVVNAKGGEGSATLSMAYAAFRFVNSLLQARLGKSDLIEYAYVYSKYHDDIDFFSDPIKLDSEGVLNVCDYGLIEDSEKAMLLTAKNQIKKDIQMGYDYVKKNYTAPANVEAKIIARFSEVKIKDAWNLSNNYGVYKTSNVPTKSKLGDAKIDSPVEKTSK